MPARKMKPVFLVICEGQSEATYVDFLRQTFRSPIKVITDVVGTSINKSLVARKTNAIKLTPTDNVRVFLMYDMDVERINRKLDECSCVKALSNPCFEVWYLLHSKGVVRSLDSNECIKKLKEAQPVWANYEKSKLTDSQKLFLKDNLESAIANAEQLKEGANPSSMVYRLVKELMSN